MKKCPVCNNNLEDSSMLCPFCGSQLQAESVSEVIVEETSSAKPITSKKKGIIWVFLGIAVVAAAVAFLIFLKVAGLPGDDSSDDGERRIRQRKTETGTETEETEEAVPGSEAGAVATSSTVVTGDCSIHGGVWDAADQSSLGSVQLILTSYDIAGLSYQAETDPDGKFVIENIPEGQYKVEAVLNGYEDLTENILVEEAEYTYIGEMTPEVTVTVDPESEPKQEQYILPESDSRYYSESELDGLSEFEIKLARNELYARHGRKFDTPEVQAYFDSCDWYTGIMSASDYDKQLGDTVFNEYEIANKNLIINYEKKYHLNGK